MLSSSSKVLFGQDFTHSANLLCEDGPSRPGSALGDNRFLELKPQREAERVRAVRQGLIPDPLKPRRLDEALPFLGTCLDMCPEFERHEREYQNNSDKWERFPGTMRIDPVKAVKAFHRPAAGNEQPLPSDVRPPHVLKTTLDYLFKTLLARESLFDTHGFIRDRTRAIRQDFTLQNERGPIAIECHERIARYHILCLHFLRDKEGIGSYQEQQELEQLRKVLQSLNEFYDDYRGSKSLRPNEAEFRAYYLLTHLRDSDAARATERLPDQIFNDQRLQCAIHLHIMAQCGNMSRAPGRRPANSPATLNAFTRLFKKISSSQTTFLSACLLETHFRDIRISALTALRAAQSRKYGDHVLLLEIAGLCAMSLQECYEFCLACGLKMTTDNLEECTVQLHKHADFDDQLLTFRTHKSSLVTAKGASLSIIELIDGLPVISPPKPTSAISFSPKSHPPLIPLVSSNVQLSHSTTPSAFSTGGSELYSSQKLLGLERSIFSPFKSNEPSAVSFISHSTSLRSHQPSPCSHIKPSTTSSASRERKKRSASIKAPSQSPLNPTFNTLISPPTHPTTALNISPALQSIRQQQINYHTVIAAMSAELFSSIEESLIAQFAQQALMDRLNKLHTEKKIQNAHIVSHFSRSLEIAILAETAHKTAFSLASEVILRKHYLKSQHQLLKNSFRKWLHISRSRRSRNFQAHSTGMHAAASIWSPGTLKDVVAQYLKQKLIPSPSLSHLERNLQVIIGVPVEASLVRAWLRCKFGIPALQNHVYVALNEMSILIKLFDNPTQLLSEDLSHVVLIILWREPSPIADPFLTQLSQDLHARSYQNRHPLITISWPAQGSHSLEVENHYAPFEHVYLSINAPEVELQSALCCGLPFSAPTTTISMDDAAFASSIASLWKKYQRKATALINSYIPKNGSSLESIIEATVITLLLRFVADMMLVIIHKTGEMLDSNENQAMTFLKSLLRLDVLSNVKPESLDNQLIEYQSSLSLSSFSLNLSNLLDMRAQLPPVEFFQLFGQHVSTVLLDFLLNCLQTFQHNLYDTCKALSKPSPRLLLSAEKYDSMLMNNMNEIESVLQSCFLKFQREVADLLPNSLRITALHRLETPIELSENEMQPTALNHMYGAKEKKLTKSDKVARLRQLISATRTTTSNSSGPETIVEKFVMMKNT
ncbi:hypothetical protein O181_030281 [Austropuccinia psidii MF-1]|uniref:SAC3/GANP/THP3 conserved domain-containing protein n=1 Tax=Austropuccinia psidii MF-1 TaxID=1389203 RepID=A0A9Q3CY65_9BASI|nr:hypothetical protein [Austropuccinia psidii MF-1]